MALPDKYEAEDVVEIPAELYAKLTEANSNVDGWTRIRDGYKKMVQTLLGKASAGMVDGQKVITYRPSNKWAESRIIKDHPDLAHHFMTTKTQVVFDMEAFKLRHPEIAEAYRIRQFRVSDDD